MKHFLKRSGNFANLICALYGRDLFLNFTCLITGLSDMLNGNNANNTKSEEMVDPTNMISSLGTSQMFRKEALESYMLQQNKSIWPQLSLPHKFLYNWFILIALLLANIGFWVIPIQTHVQTRAVAFNHTTQEQDILTTLLIQAPPEILESLTEGKSLTIRDLSAPYLQQEASIVELNHLSDGMVSIWEAYEDFPDMHSSEHAIQIVVMWPKAFVSENALLHLGELYDITLEAEPRPLWQLAKVGRGNG